MREEREEKRKKEMEKRKLLLKDISSVLKEAKKMGCKKVNFYQVPVENLELVMETLLHCLRKQPVRGTDETSDTESKDRGNGGPSWVAASV